MRLSIASEHTHNANTHAHAHTHNAHTQHKVENTEGVPLTPHIYIYIKPYIYFEPNLGFGKGVWVVLGAGWGLGPVGEG